MKRHVQKTGVRKYFGADLVELQSEPLAALDAFFAQYGPCIVQGCEIAPNPAGTFDVAAGLVALEADDPDGTRRVMVMPFAGASGVALPLYLTAQAQAVERVYGDGKVKPIAYAYTAQAAGVEPAAGVPRLALTAEGANRFVDAVQDAGHRFISDAERSRWNRILEQAKEYADSVAATGSEAAVRRAKEYTDTRETAILAAADARDAVTLTDAKAYADRIVAALAGSAPETLDTLQELAAALGNDPNFAATVLQQIGEKATMEQVNAALVGKFDKTGGDVDGELNVKGNPAYQDGGRTLIGRDGNGAYFNSIDASGNTTAQLRLRNDHRITFWKPGAGSSFYDVWHSGNFDPAGKQNTTTNLGTGYDLNNLHTTGTYNIQDARNAPIAGYIYVDVIKFTAGAGWVSQFVYTFGANNTPNRIFHRNGMNTSEWSPWVELWHSGNFDPNGLFRSDGYFESSALNNAEMAMIGNKASIVDYGGYGGLLVSFSAQASASPLQFLLDRYQDNTPLRWRHGIDNNRFGNPNFRTIYDSENLGPATASANGLMSAADKAKLDNLPPKIIAGSVQSDGKIRKGQGFSAYVSGDYIRVTHNVGHTNYIVTATAYAAGNTTYRDNTVSTIIQAVNYFDLSVTNGGNNAIERCIVDFMLVCI